MIEKALMNPSTDCRPSMEPRTGSKKTGDGATWLSRASRNLDVPVNRLISQSSSFLIFICMVLLTQTNPIDGLAEWDINFYDACAVIWAVAYILADLQVSKLDFGFYENQILIKYSC